MNNPLNLVYTIEPSIALFYNVLFGAIDVRHLIEFEPSLSSDPLRHPGMKIIIDLTLVTALNYDTADFKRQIDMNQRVMDAGRTLEPTAIIGRDDYDVTFGDIVESIASAAVPLNMRVFLTLREAVEWLDLADKYDEIAKIQHTLRLQVFELPRPGDKRSLNGKLDIRLLHDKTLAQEPLNEDEDEKRDDDKDEGKGHSDI